MTTDTNQLPLPSTSRSIETASASFENVRLAWLGSLRSDNTRDAYGRDLDAFEEWLATKSNPVPWNLATHSTMDAYVETLTRQGKSNATVARKLSALSSFYKYAMRTGTTNLSPFANDLVQRPKVSNQTSVVGLTTEEATRICAVATDNPRDLALVRLMFDVGLRVSEALFLRIERDFRDERGHHVVVIHGKGQKTRTGVLPVPTYRAVQTLMDGRTEGWLFETATGSQLSRGYAWRIVRRLAQKAGMDAVKVHPHAFRHTHATVAFERGATIYEVQKALGHADPRTSERYLHAMENLDKHTAHLVAAAIG